MSKAINSAVMILIMRVSVVATVAACIGRFTEAAVA